jgi:DNA-binding LytR/AlgR family response regulator
MKCIIIDDEKIARAALKKLCEKVDFLESVAEFNNPLEAIDFLNREEIDLVFLDIHMPDFSGFDFLSSVKNVPEVIITTSDDNFGVQAFEYDVSDYILKPVSTPRFIKAVNKVRDERMSAERNGPDSKEKHIFINVNSRLVRLNYDDILFMEARGDYVQIQTPKKKHLVHATMKRFAEKLPPNRFVQVHRSYIVNINKIVDIEDNSILIAEEIIPISRSNKEELLNRLNTI